MRRFINAYQIYYAANPEIDYYDGTFANAVQKK
jgi:hypothetical protein